MCVSEHHLKLCTCDDINKSDSNWTLRRFKGCDWMDVERGRCLSPDYTDQNILTGKDILKQLDNNCFDFNYVPEEGDVLDIVISVSDKKTPYEFIYENHKWNIESSISSHLNKQYIVKKGFLE